jgi:hypothetical protein
MKRCLVAHQLEQLAEQVSPRPCHPHHEDAVTPGGLNALGFDLVRCWVALRREATEGARRTRCHCLFAEGLDGAASHLDQPARTARCPVAGHCAQRRSTWVRTCQAYRRAWPWGCRRSRRPAGTTAAVPPHRTVFRDTDGPDMRGAVPWLVSKVGHDLRQPDRIGRHKIGLSGKSATEFVACCSIAGGWFPAQRPRRPSVGHSMHQNQLAGGHPAHVGRSSAAGHLPEVAAPSWRGLAR